MLIAFFLSETFKEDVLRDVIPITGYATTVRRKVIDIAGKIINTGRRIMDLFLSQLRRILCSSHWQPS
jgi:hypothetical protein